MSAPEHVNDVYHDDAADDIELDDEVEDQQQQHQQRLANEQAQQRAAGEARETEDSLCEDAVTPTGGGEEENADGSAAAPPARDPTIPCAHCGHPVGGGKTPATKDGPIHIGCVLEYRFLHQPRCHYCDIRFLDSEAGRFVKDEATGRLYHPECRQQELKGVPYARPTKEGEVRKFAIARSKLSRHNWKTRYFILSPMYDGIRYFEQNPHDNGKKEKEAAGAKDGSSGDSPSEDDTFDPDADPKLVEEHAKKAKGLVPLDRNRARLITHPAASTYKINSAAASMQNDIAIIFFDSPENNTEHRLLFQCKDAKEKQKWVRALESYIHTVDDPKDYGANKEIKKK